MKYLHIKFNNFFDYQTIWELLNAVPIFLTPKLAYPDELKLSFVYYYSNLGIIEYVNKLCKPLNITFTTEIGVYTDEQITFNGNSYRT